MNDKLTELKRLMEEDRNSQEYKAEAAILDLTENIVGRMEELNLNRVKLAEKLDISKSMVTKILRGNANFTIKSLVNITSALDCELSIDFIPCGFKNMHIYVSRDETKILDYSEELDVEKYRQEIPVIGEVA